VEAKERWTRCGEEEATEASRERLLKEGYHPAFGFKGLGKIAM
jgi:hypothetical protein